MKVAKTLATLFLSFGTFDSFQAGWAEIDCTVDVALPKRTANVLSFESTDECLRTKSENNKQ